MNDVDAFFNRHGDKSLVLENADGDQRYPWVPTYITLNSLVDLIQERLLVSPRYIDPAMQEKLDPDEPVKCSLPVIINDSADTDDLVALRYGVKIRDDAVNVVADMLIKELRTRDAVIAKYEQAALDCHNKAQGIDFDDD